MADQDSSTRAPTTAEVHRRWIESFSRRLNKCIPGVVTAWDASQQMCTVQPLVMKPFLDEEGARQVESLATIAHVPLVFPGCGPIRITFPVSDGTLVINGQTIPATKGVIFFADRSLDRWLANDGREVDPDFDHNHAEADAIFVPGLNSFGAALGDVPTDHLTIGFDGGLQIHVKADQIVMGNPAAADYVALAGKVKAELDKIALAFNAATGHTHSFAGGAVGQPNGGNVYDSASDVAASKAKAE